MMMMGSQSCDRVILTMGAFTLFCCETHSSQISSYQLFISLFSEWSHSFCVYSGADKQLL